jgi:CRISPR-associated exonuclease Cas4
MYSEDELLPISALQHLLFCERRAALVCLEGLWQDNISTVQGSIFHERTHQMETECRNDLRIARGLWLKSLRLGISGKADVVEFKRLNEMDTKLGVCLSGEQGYWQPFPVEYKRGRLREEISYETQLCAQGLCLEEMLGIEIKAGALYYGQTHRRLEINFDKNLCEKTESAAIHLHEIITSGITPKAKIEPKCKYCSLNSLCLPRISKGKKSVAGYLKMVYKAEGENEATP